MREMSAAAFALFASVAFAGNVANPDAVELVPLPKPVEFKSDMDSPVAFDATATVAVDCPDAESAKWLAAHFAEWYGDHAPKVVASGLSTSQPSSLSASDESYAVSADASGVKIAARSLAGVRWAAYSIRQLAIAKRGTFKTEGWILPTVTISDSPHLAFRCIHLCWFPETRTEHIERAIRLAALLKFNYAIIEPWGVYRSERHPWWGWPDGKMTKAEVRRLAALGRDLGIVLIPQLNVYGHASASRTRSLKHSVLGPRPEYAPLFEPGGWNWCLSNPEAQRVMRELIAEMHDDFGNPPFFHLGCDEAQPPTCPECRKTPYAERVCRHIAGLADFVKSRGARAMIWHDMLLDRNDPRWTSFVRHGSEVTATLADTLPKDVIVCDWQYSYGNMKEVRTDWPTMGYFHEKGFSVAGCPWMNYNAMRPMADYIARIGGFGFIETTWHKLGGQDLVDMFRHASSAAWGTDVRGNGRYGATPSFDTEFATVLGLVGADMKATEYGDSGAVEHQLPPACWMND